MTLKKCVWIGAAAGALFVAVQANAADLNGGFKDGPRMISAPFWTGLYLGVNGGYGWRQTDDQFSYAACVTDCQGDPYPAYAGIGAEGGFGGGQIGYSVQGALGTPWLVTGIEADFQGAGITGSGTDTLGENYKTSLDWFGTVRGRIGYAANNTLIYFTGGYAFGGLKQHAENNYYTPTAVYESDGTAGGYVLGGGLEYKFSPSWSLKAEYQYLNFGKNDAALVPNADYYPTTPPSSAAADSYKIGEDAFHTVRVGLNYWINPAQAPLK
jgi:outer membrane immunogenic protein